MAPCLLEMTSLSPLLKRKTLMPSIFGSTMVGSGLSQQPGREVLLDRVLEVLGDVVRQVAHSGTTTG